MKNITPRRLAILGIALLTPLVLSILFAQKSLQDEWPFSAVDTAEEVSLSTAYDLVHAPLDGRRAAILGNFLYVESPSGASGGNADTDSPETTTGLGENIPDRLEGSEDQAVESADGIQAETVRARLPYPAFDIITDLVSNADIPVTIHRSPEYEVSLLDRLIQLLPIIVIVALGLFLLSRGATRSLGLNSSFEVVESKKLTESFDSVAGIDTARSEIQEIVDFLKDPKAASRLGGRMPKGAIFSGPPGTGKTLLARAMAREAGVPFISIEASGVNQLFVGAGAMKIKRAFREARKQAPCIVFIDEIDALGQARGSSPSGAGDEKATTLNALLVELDGFDSREGVVVIAATNRPEILDKALTRRGRIDRHIHVDLPDIDGREEILRVHVHKVKALPNLNLRRVAETTFGFSGADLAALVNEAALMATRAGHDNVTAEDFEKARDRMLVGLSGSQRRLDGKNRRITAVHEAGHAIVAGALRDADRIEKATILPQGGALGYVLQSPQEDHVFETRRRLLAKIRVAVAGRAAESLVFGEGSVTSGAASDIQAATRVARAMVTRFGMSDQGFVLVDPQDPALYDTNKPPLADIRHIIRQQMSLVEAFLKDNRDVLERLADLLEEEETVSGDQILSQMEELVGNFEKR